jgi:hypothetical protein
MENKYFIPDIEELCIGYECEIYAQNTDKLIRKVGWHTVTVHFSPMISKHVGLNQVPRLSKTKHIRVPYLTKEQIEAEGWEHIAVYGNNRNDNYTMVFQKTSNYKYELSFHNYDNLILIEQLRHTVDKVVRENFFKGECKDINTFRKIIKLLGI